MILLDLMLPGMSGEKLLSMIREIPIIVVSAKTDADAMYDELPVHKSNNKIKTNLR